ncbi:MAG: DUF615 domain-containing protein [Proteobacteria bacterium]|nr:DUF615 domain-containing protein [Pseudomonadota bacterium]
MVKKYNHFNRNKTQDSTEEVISKTSQKKLAHSLQDLAKELSKLPKSKLAKINLPLVLSDAITESKKITSHIARKRHFQYMGKQLLKTDYQTIIAEMDQFQQLDAAFHVRDMIINNWITQLIAGNQNLIDSLYTQYDHNEIQPVKQLIRKCIKKPDDSASRKKLFQALRKLDQIKLLQNP